MFDERQKVFSEKKIPQDDLMLFCLSELFRLLPTNNFGLRNYSDCWQKSFSTFGIFPCEENK